MEEVTNYAKNKKPFFKNILSYAYHSKALVKSFLIDLYFEGIWHAEEKDVGAILRKDEILGASDVQNFKNHDSRVRKGGCRPAGDHQ